MQDTRPAARALMACLGNHSRFRLVQALIGGPRCVTDLAAEVRLSQSCTTRHLQALEQRGVVRGTRDGKRVLYRIREDQPDLGPLLGWALQAGAAVGARRPTQVRPATPRSPRARPAPVAAFQEPTVPTARETVPAGTGMELGPSRPGRPRHATDLEDFLL